jgi:putative flippase GtrA
LIAQALRFAVVGFAATLIHYVVALAAVAWAGAPPQAGNLAGFVVAFVVSLVGQARWTFAAQRAPWRRAAPRHFAISLLAFALNAAALETLLRLTLLRYELALALVLAAVAAITFVASRRWTFAGMPR